MFLKTSADDFSPESWPNITRGIRRINRVKANNLIGFAFECPKINKF
jgi:hypothetical protein